MQFSGYLISKDFVDNSKTSKSDFYRITISVEEGFDLSLYKMYAFEDTVVKKINALEVGCGVNVEGYISSKEYKVATKIEKVTHDHCAECNMVIDQDKDNQDCVGCLKTKQERITGVWELKSLAEMSKDGEESDTKAVKLFFRQKENALCVVAFPNAPHFKIMSELDVGDKVTVYGWRNEKRHTKVSMVKKNLKRKRV